MSEILDFNKFPYTYNKIEKLLQAVKTYGVAELIDIPIPLESVKINFYLFPKTISNVDFDNPNLVKDKYLAGSGYYFGINRVKNFCARCYSSRTNITIDISNYLIKNSITDKNIDNYDYTIFGIGLINPNTFFTEKDLLFDGKIKIIFHNN
jgi:hypothetical protein